MLSTNLSYQLVTRDIGKSLDRVGKQPVVKRETEYFLANIGKVKSPEDFVKNTRLFNYAMKAFGLSDMAYAKGFMLKAMKEGVSDPDSFANRLSDKRYAEFVKAFNFDTHGESTTTYNAARDVTASAYVTRATLAGLDPEAIRQETAHFRETIGTIESIDDLLDSPRLLTYALEAFSLEEHGFSRAELAKLLEGGVKDADSPANKHEDKNVARFVAAFNFAEMGERTTTHVAAQHDTVANYLRQTLEENAGDQNEGVRLALYFQRKAPTLTSYYQILGDPALAEVTRTALGMPAEMAQADIDRQVAAMEKRFKLEDLKDPAKLDKFLARFSAMWDASNATATATSPALALLAPATDFGISASTLMAITTLKR